MTKTVSIKLFLSQCLLFLSIVVNINSVFAQEIRHEQFEDGVEHWYRINKNNTPWFFQQIENVSNIIFSYRKLPFGKSTAFLVGVSKYYYLSPQLPFVKNDLEDMRNFLLMKGGFDEVYVISNETVNRDLIEEYIRNKIPRLLKPEDRFLFYYSGHGGDNKGKTGYMQFSEAQPGNFVGPQVLAINDVDDWCSEININHMLFIFDCCASGLVFATRGNNDSAYNKIIATLSRNGSRSVITAGTADEKTFEVKLSNGRGNGVFTRAFLNAIETGKADQEQDGFITIDEIMAQIKQEIAYFAVSNERSISPRMWELDPNNYRGTFVFLNPEARALGTKLMGIYSEKIVILPKTDEDHSSALPTIPTSPVQDSGNDDKKSG